MRSQTGDEVTGPELSREVSYSLSRRLLLNSASQMAETGSVVSQYIDVIEPILGNVMEPIL